MRQQTKFWIGLLLITFVCFLDYQFFIEGYNVRKLSSTTRQVGHLVVLIVVTGIGYWAWAKHSLTFLKKIWLTSYLGALVFILLTGLLKTQTDLLGGEFYEWAATVRYAFCSPLPHLLLYMLLLVAQQKNN